MLPGKFTQSRCCQGGGEKILNAPLVLPGTFAQIFYDKIKRETTFLTEKAFINFPAINYTKSVSFAFYEINIL
jgi:hypothetical protein